MRHVFLPGAITARPKRVTKATATAVLIALLCCFLFAPARAFRAIGMTVALPVIAAATKMNLATAFRAQEESGDRFQRCSQMIAESAGHLSL